MNARSPLPPTRWFRVHTPRPYARLRLLCLAHAGGSASFFRHWAALLPDTVEVLAVQYPGREERLDEPMLDEMDALAGALADACLMHPGLRQTPYVLFGHSMGGAVAYELCRHLRRAGGRMPASLVLSACESPARHQGGALHQQDDATLLAEMGRLGASQLDWSAHPELAQLVLPAMRNDYRLIERWQPAEAHAPLDLPLEVLIGQDDSELDEADARDWARYTTRGCRLTAYPGGHFYLLPHREAVLQHLGRTLTLAELTAGPALP